EVGKVGGGQEDVVRGVVTGLAVGGHVLLEGPPGVAKTLLASAVARALGLEFRRVQFTPDMLPSDVTGTSTLRAGELEFRPGPVFTNLLLADEINRTPPKTQAALLEAMQEGQVSADGEAHPLPDPFLVVATQNPIEYEGTYPLPEAQLDRFLVRVDVGYPSEDDERRMLELARRGVAPAALDDVQAVASADDLRAARAVVGAVVVDTRAAARPLRIDRRVAPVLARGVPASLDAEASAPGRRAPRLRQAVPPDLALDPQEATGELRARLTPLRRG